MFSEASFCDFVDFKGIYISKKLRSNSFSRTIIVDCVAINKNNGGISILAKSIIKGICKKRPDWCLIVLCGVQEKQFFHFNAPNVKVIPTKYSYLHEPLRLIRSILNLFTFWYFEDQITQLLCYNNIYFNSASCDLFFDPYAELTINDYKSIPKISLIHDLLYKDMPECFTDDRSKLDEISKNGLRILRDSSKIVTVSNFSKKRIENNFQKELSRVNRSSRLIQVIPIRLGNRLPEKKENIAELAILNKFGLKKQKYFIYPSAVRLRKNHKRLIRAFVRHNIEHESNIKLAIVGAIHQKVIKELYAEVDREVERITEEKPEVLQQGSISRKGSNSNFCQVINLSKSIKSKIIYTQFISDKYLEVLLRNAVAMIFSSIYEGFGMPIVESMKARVPVACSNTASLPEVAGNATLLFDPYSVKDIADAMYRVSTDEILRQKLVNRGIQRAEYFSNEDAMIDEYIELFETCMSQKSFCRKR